MAQQGERQHNIELIKEKMKERRRKKALGDSNTSWSRSFTKRKATSASFVLKASLRSNNQSLAKALATSRHETQQAHRSVLELQRDRQYLLQQANSQQLFETECKERFGQTKQVLTKVTTSLMDAVTLLSQALDLCTFLPVRSSSSSSSSSSIGFPRARPSLTSDDSFRLSSLTDQGSSNYCGQAEKVAGTIQQAASGVLQAATVATAAIGQSSEPVPAADRSQCRQAPASRRPDPSPAAGRRGRPAAARNSAAEDDDGLMDIQPETLDLDISLRFADEPVDPRDIDSRRRQSQLLTAPPKNPRRACYLDANAVQQALATDEEEEEEDEVAKIRPSPAADPPGKSIRGVLKGRREVGANPRRRATFVVGPSGPEEEEPADGTFEALDPSQLTEAQRSFVWPELAAQKKRHVFVHSPPGQYRNHKTPAAEEFATAAETDSSAPTPELGSPTANKSSQSHDEKIIRPWGNLQADKSLSAAPQKTATGGIIKKVPTETQPTAGAAAAQSKLPKPQEKAPGKSSEKKQLGRDCPARKKPKDAKAAAKKPKKTTFQPDSTKSDLGIFDLSAGESFSLPPPVYKKLKPKPVEELPVRDARKSGEGAVVGTAATERQTEKAAGIKRKSKKARSVVTPSIDKAAAARGAKPCPPVPAAGSGLDGTFLGALPTAVPLGPTADPENAGETSTSAKHCHKPGQKSKDKHQGKRAQPLSGATTESAEGRIKDVRDLSPAGPKPANVANADKPSSIPRLPKPLRPSLEGAPPAGHPLKDAGDAGAKKTRPRGRPRLSPQIPLTKPIPAIPTHPRPGGRTPAAASAASSGGADPGVGPFSPQPGRGRKRGADSLWEGEEGVPGPETEEANGDTGRRRCRGAPVNYKEPNLHSKLRRDASPKKMKKKPNGRKCKRTSLETVTNIL